MRGIQRRIQRESFATVLAELDKYRLAHEAALARPHAARFLVFSTELHRANRNGTSRSLVGGLADRLKGLLSCSLLAALTDRAFLVDWQWPLPIVEHFSPAGIAWNSIEDVAGLGAPFVAEFIDEQGVRKFDRYLAVNGNVSALFQSKALVRIHANMLLIGSLLARPSLLQQTALGRALSRLVDEFSAAQVEHDLPAILFEFLLRYRPQRRALDIWNDFQHRSRDAAIIGVHFRSGGDGAWNDPVMDSIDWLPDVNQAIVTVAQRQFGGNCQVLVTADSARIRGSLTNMVPDRYRAYTYDGDAWHYERSGTGAVANVDFAVAEFMCLSQCDFVVHGRGNFGLMAALTGARPHAAYWQLSGNGTPVAHPVSNMLRTLGRRS